MKTFFTVKFALIPFAVFWALLGAGHPDWAIWLGLVLSLAGNLWRAARRDLVVLELGGLVLFAFLAAALTVSRDWTAGNALWLSFAGLGGISLVSLIFGHPWTADYARAAFPDSAGTPQFRIINAAITGLWGVLFLVIGICRYFGVSEFVTMAIVISGALISIFGPRYAVNTMLERLRAGQETFRWPAPILFGRHQHRLRRRHCRSRNWRIDGSGLARRRRPEGDGVRPSCTGRRLLSQLSAQGAS